MKDEEDNSDLVESRLEKIELQKTSIMIDIQEILKNGSVKDILDLQWILDNKEKLLRNRQLIDLINAG